MDEMAEAGADVVDISARYTEVDESVSGRFHGLLAEPGD
jgi:hypothetical protein